MIQSKNLTVKNFMSVGNATQGIDFESEFYNSRLLLQIYQKL
jgi:hypothetical protein